MSAWVEKHCMGLVLYEFKANGAFQIDLAAGEKVEVLKQSSGWFRGKVVGGREAKGIFPVSFIQLLPDEPLPGAGPALPPPPPAALPDDQRAAHPCRARSEREQQRQLPP